MELDGQPADAAVPQRTGDKKQKTKRSRRVPRSTQTVHEGIKSAILAKGQEPTPTAYFACLVTLLHRPDPDTLFHLLTLLDVIVRQVPTNVAIKCQRRVMQLLANVVHQHSREPKIARKALRCLRSLFKVTEITEFHLSKMEAFQPSKFNVDVMVAYNQLMSSIFIGLHGTKRALCFAHLPYLIDRFMTQFVEDTPEVVTRSGATELRKILQSCLSVELIDEHRDAPDEQKAQTTLGRIVGFMAPALHTPVYKPNWDLLSLCFGDMFRKLGRYSCPLLNEVLVVLDNLRVHGGWQYANATERAIGYAINAIGAENLFRVIPYDITERSDSRAYLIPLVRKHLSHDSLNFFVTHLVPLADKCKEMAAASTAAKCDLATKDWELRFERLFSTLPAFCKFPTDVAEGDHYMRLAKKMVDLLKESDEIVTYVTTAWVSLIKGNRRAAEGKPLVPKTRISEDEVDEDDDDQSEAAPSVAETQTTEASEHQSLVSFTDKSLASVSTIADGGERGGTADALEFYHDSMRESRRISQEQGKANVAVLARYAKIIIPRLCNLAERVTNKNVRGHVLSAIDVYASIADPAVLDPIFGTLLQQLHSDGNNVQKISNMLCVGTALVDNLSEEKLLLLFRTMPTMLSQEAWQSEQMVYKILIKLINHRREFAKHVIGDIFTLLGKQDQKQQCSPIGTRLRLVTDALELLWETSQDTYATVAAQHAAEFVMHVTNHKEKVKDAALYGIYMIGFRVKEKFGTADPLVQRLIQLLHSDVTREVSCSIVVLGKFFYEEYGTMPRTMAYNILSNCLGLIKSEKVPVHDAVFTFLRLALKATTFSEELHELFKAELLPVAVEGVLYWVNQRDIKRGLRVNLLVVLRIIMEKMLKRFGIEEISRLTPEPQRKWVRFVEKQREATERKKAKAREQREQDTAEAKKALEAKFKLFYKSDDKKIERKKRQLINEARTNREAAVLMRTGEDVQDLSDPTIVSAFVANPKRRDYLLGEGDADDEYLVDLDTDGTIVVSGRAPKTEPRRKPQTIAESSGGMFTPAESGAPASRKDFRKRKRFEEDDDDEEEAVDEAGLEKAVPMETPVINVPKTAAQQRVAKIKEEMSLAKRRKFERDYNTKIHSGASFRGRHGAAGDIKKDSKEPYAYIPLNHALLDKRMKKVAHHQFDSVSAEKRVRQTPTRNKANAVRKHSARIGGSKKEARESQAREKRLRSARKSNKKSESKLGGGIHIS